MDFNKRKLTRLLKDNFCFEAFENEDYEYIFDNVIEFITKVLGRNVDNENLIKELTKKYFEIVKQEYK